MTKPESPANNPEPELNLFRDTYLRYLGYANEVGEAFRPLVPGSLVSATYGMAVAYVISDAYAQAHRAQQRGASNHQVLLEAGDVFTWQTLASVAIPGATINRITWLTKTLLNAAKQPKYLVRTLPTALGLVSVPFIIQPIDNMVDHLMDRTYRKWIT